MTNDIRGGGRYIVNQETGVLVDPNGQAIAKGIEYAINNKHFNPRESYLKTRGRYHANNQLSAAIAEISTNQGSPLDITQMRMYGGDLWSYDYYHKIADNQLKEEFLKAHPNII